MRKNVYGRHLKRDIDERKALFKGLLTDLVIRERIQTTLEKAKSIKGSADKLITKAKYQDRLHAYSLLTPLVASEAVDKLLNDLAPRFTDRHGGYTRIIKVQRRFSDNARMAMIEWTEQNSKFKIQNSKLESKKETDTRRKTTIKQAIAKITAKPEKTKKTSEKKIEKKSLTEEAKN